MDFDLSDSEVKEAVTAFESGSYASPLEVTGEDKEDADTLLARYNVKKVLAVAD